MRIKLVLAGIGARTFMLGSGGPASAIQSSDSVQGVCVDQALAAVSIRGAV